MNAALAVAMLRHQHAFRVPVSALSAAMGWADWPARLQHLAPGPLVGDREVWLDGGHNPSAARQIATYAKHQFDDGKPLHLVFASLATKDPLGHARAVRGHGRRTSTRCRSPTTPAFLRSDLVEIAGELGFAADAA